MLRRHLLVITSAGLMALCACSQRPPVTYAPAASSAELAAALSTSDVPAPESGYRLLAAPSEGRFACDLAIAKLSRATTTRDAPLTLVTPRPAEQAYWSEQFRGVRQVRGIVFVPPRTLRPEGLNLAALCDAAERLGAPLLLVYVTSTTGPDAADTVGLLYETSSRAPLASLRSTGRGHATDDAPGGSLDEAKGDYRDQDARFQAQREFEHVTLACLGELMRMDRPPAATQPHRWHQPFVERWWMTDRRGPAR